MSKNDVHISGLEWSQEIVDAIPDVGSDTWLVEAGGQNGYFTLYYAPRGQERQPIAQHLFLEELRSLHSVLSTIVEKADEAITHLQEPQLEKTPSPACTYADGECTGPVRHQCPACKQWYCDEHRSWWLPIDGKTWVETAMMCVQCHYNRYGRARA